MLPSTKPLSRASFKLISSAQVGLGQGGKTPLLPLGSDLIKCSRRRVRPGLEGGARPKSLPGVCVNRARQVPSEDPGGGVCLLFPLISTNNKVNTFITCVPRLVSEKDTHAAFGEMSGRARDPWLHRKLSEQGGQYREEQFSPQGLGGGGQEPRAQARAISLC